MTQMHHYRPLHLLIAVLAFLHAPTSFAEIKLGENQASSVTLAPLPSGDDANHYDMPFASGSKGVMEGLATDGLAQRDVHRAEPTMPMIKPIAEGGEGFNRSMHGFNRFFTGYIIDPTHAIYRLIFPSPVRKSITKLGYNLAYPVRVINCGLQGKGRGMLDETNRFLINTTIGIVGLFDPATKWGIPTHNEDFGQSFGKWGWGEPGYLELPMLGPSTSRDLVAYPFNAVFNPTTFVPGLGFFFTYNDLTFSLPRLKRLDKMESDPYLVIRDLWAINRKKDVIDFEIPPGENAPAPTLAAIFLHVKDPEFPKKMKEDRVRLDTTGRKLPYSYWVQPTPAPLVFIIPGAGGHRISDGAEAIAEMVYNKGFSAVAISNSMNWEFMKYGATHPLPGFPPEDARDVYAAIDAIHKRISKKYPGRFTATGVMGLSLGGIQTLFMSALDRDAQVNRVKIDRFVAVNTPVDLIHSMQILDDYYNAPMDWPEPERQRRIENTLMKAIKMSEDGDLTPNKPLQFDEIESEFLIGLSFRMTLRDVLYNSQARDDLGVLSIKPGSFARQPAYDEIGTFGFMDYYVKFVQAYYAGLKAGGISLDQLAEQASVWSIRNELAAQDKVRVFTNENDFLLLPGHLRLLKDILGDRLRIFTGGGHLGNLHLPEVQAEIMKSLEDLKRIQPVAK